MAPRWQDPEPTLNIGSGEHVSVYIWSGFENLWLAGSYIIVMYQVLYRLDEDLHAGDLAAANEVYIQ